MSSNHQQPTKRRLDYDLIERLVPAGSRVLDLGCGDGQLLELLAARKGCQGHGIDINEQAVLECIRRGVAAYHGDMMEGMSFYQDHTFDLVILSQTLQQTANPVQVIREMLRVGETAIISFPNFGYWRVRFQLLLTGRMPRNALLPYSWYSTPNVHLCTISDFRALCEQEQLERVHEIFLAPPSRQISELGANWRAGLAIFQLRRKR
ncbi:MAG: methionine biosynthesis protein MetW [Chloroflexi bacterium]|jgi:methionine biosynthesis protein MetW|nr:methionine biosynthesis protein MetW [Chloroflexota bacterium]